MTGTTLRNDPCTGARGTDCPLDVRARLPTGARVPPRNSRLRRRLVAPGGLPDLTESTFPQIPGRRLPWYRG